MQCVYDALNRVTDFLETSQNGNQNQLTTYDWDKEGNRKEEIRYNVGQTNQIVGNVNQGNSDSGNNGNTPPAPSPLSVVASKAGDEITISVQDGEDTLVSQIVPFAKNTTQVYDVGGYTVEIVYNGGGVKSAEILGGNPEPGTGTPTPPNPTVPTGLSVATSMSGEEVTISVQNAESVLATTIVPFAKNTTQLYDVGGYNVEVVYNGGKVKFAQLVEESTEPTEPIDPVNPIDPTEPGNGNGNGNTKYPVTGTFQYDFDDLYRVVEAYEPNKDRTWFTYDSLGNLVKEVGGSGEDKSPIIYQYNNLNQLLQWTQKGDTVVFDYDERGNLISEVGPVSLNTDSQYTYDGTNRLVEGINWTDDKSFYTYNGLGWRVNQTEIMHSGSTEIRDYVLDYTSATRRDLVIYKPDQTTQRHVYANGSRVEQITEHGPGNSGNGNMERLLYVHSGVMGTSIRYSKDTGQQFASMDFDLFGWVLSPNMLVNNDNGVDVIADFTGYVFDTVLDKYFAQYRFYDAFNRRFMAEDPIKDGLNWYAYVGNNPVTWVDPLGLAGEWMYLLPGDVDSTSPLLLQEQYDDGIKTRYRDPKVKHVGTELYIDVSSAAEVGVFYDFTLDEAGKLSFTTSDRRLEPKVRIDVYLNNVVEPVSTNTKNETLYRVESTISPVSQYGKVPYELQYFDVIRCGSEIYVSARGLASYLGYRTSNELVQEIAESQGAIYLPKDREDDARKIVTSLVLAGYQGYQLLDEFADYMQVRSASRATANIPYNNYGEVKTQIKGM